MLLRSLMSAILAIAPSFVFKLQVADAAQNQASSFFGRAGEAIARRDYKKAREYLNQAIALDPNNGRFYVVRGHVLSWLNSRDCLDDFNKAIKMYPKEAELYAARGEREFVYKDNAAALEDIERAIELDPKQPQFHLFRSLFLQKGNTKEAIEEARTALSLAPAEHKYHAALISAREGTATNTELLSEINNIIESAPKCSLCLIRRSQIQLALSNPTQAKQDADKAYHLEKNKDICVAYGIVLTQNGDFARAEKLYSEALQLSPDDPQALRCRAHLRLALKRPKEAIVDLNRAIALFPGDAQTYKMRADCYSALGQKANADKDYARAFQMAPELDTFRSSTKAKEFEKKQDYRRALQEYNKLIVFDGSGLVYMHRAGCLEKTGNLDAAVKDYKKAYQIAPKLEAKARRARANVLVRIKNFREALVEFDRLVELFPGDNQLRYTRADMYEALGDKRKAQAERAKADEMLDNALQKRRH